MSDECRAKVVFAAEDLDHRWGEDFLGELDELEGRIRREWTTRIVSGAFMTGDAFLTRA